MQKNIKTNKQTKYPKKQKNKKTLRHFIKMFIKSLNTSGLEPEKALFPDYDLNDLL